MDEPIQIEELGHRPPWLATIIEDGENRHYVLPEYAAEERECLSKLPASMLSFVGSDNEAYPNDDYPRKIGDPSKNRIAKLRDCTPSISVRTTSASGPKPIIFGDITRNIQSHCALWSSGLDTVFAHR
jgi:hypothetical protein